MLSVVARDGRARGLVLQGRLALMPMTITRSACKCQVERDEER